jgi:hypothetical protein
VTAKSRTLHELLGDQWTLSDHIFSFQAKLKCMTEDQLKAMDWAEQTFARMSNAGSQKKTVESPFGQANTKTGEGNNNAAAQNGKNADDLSWNWKNSVNLPEELNSIDYRTLLERFAPAMLRTLLPLHDKINKETPNQLDNRTLEFIKSYIEASDFDAGAAAQEALNTSTSVMTKADVQSMRRVAIQQWISNIDAMLQNPQEYFDFTYQQGAHQSLKPTGANSYSTACTFSKALLNNQCTRRSGFKNAAWVSNIKNEKRRAHRTIRNWFEKCAV